MAFLQAHTANPTPHPARLDLNNTFLNDSKEWIFLNSHSHYKGRGFFFPLTKSEIDKSDYALERLPDEGDDPRLLRHAVFRFLCRVAFLNLSDTSEQTSYSMLIHTAGKTNDHEKDQHDLQSILDVLSDQQAGKFEKYFIEMLSICDNLIKLDLSRFSAAPRARLSHLSFESDRAFPAQC